MRTLFTAFILVLLVNALALGSVLGWLGATDRLSKQRVREAAGVFNHTIQEQAALDAEKAKAEQEALELAEQALRLEQVAGGPMEPEQRLAALQQVDEKQRALIERRKVEVEQLQRQLDTQRKLIEQRLAELDEKQQAFNQAVAAQLEEMEQEDFQEAIAMLEGIPPKQAKAVFQELLKAGDQEQVVSYLSAMQARKAAKVLQEFKLPNEIAQAADLIEQLRLRSEQVKQEAAL
ncbi:MAG: hypothetical protein ACE37H_04600 [Phycisphaeraceae bacterium]